MKLKILGCSGGIGGVGMKTTSLQLDGHILLDAGTGVGDLSLTEMSQIDHVFLTHAHLDHIACLPLMLDSIWGMSLPLTVHAPAAVLEALKMHIFNWVIWPDFTVLPSVENPCVVLEAFEVGDFFDFEGGQIRALPVSHGVPAVAYEIRRPTGSTVFSGDTGGCSDLAQALREIPHLRTLIVECAFPNQEKALAIRSGHFCPELLVEWLKGVPVEQLLITHLKPQMAELTINEISISLAHQRGVKPVRLIHGTDMLI